jgi:DNA segregation ATPase FtsK/SpoIIIE, S-DNA-T family
MSELFKREQIQIENKNFLDEVLHPEAILFVVFILKDKLERITLTEQNPIVRYNGMGFSVINDVLYVGGDILNQGFSVIEELALFVLPADCLETHFLSLNYGDIVISKTNPNSAVQVKDDSTIIIENHHSELPKVLIEPVGRFIYLNGNKVTEKIGDNFSVGDTILTPDLMLERRPTQWKITVFSDDIVFNHDYFIEQHRKVEKPQDFPEYRRSPRLNLERPEESFKYEKIPDEEKAPKGGLVKAIIPPIGMLSVGILTTVMSGRNPLMMAATGLASLMTMVFTVTQYQTEKKERLEREKHRESDYQEYLLKTTSKLGLAYRQEKKVLDYQQPSPQILLEKITQFDSRLYERMVNNKDFMHTSLGTGNKPSTLRVES